MLDKVIGYVHIILAVIVTSYFLWSGASLDNYFIIYFCLLNISWVLFNDECLITYFHKVYTDGTYKMGQNKSISDYNLVLGDQLSARFIDLLLFMYLFNMCVILNRATNKLPALAVILSYVMYIGYLRSTGSSGSGLVKSVHLFVNALVVMFLLYKRK